MFRIDHRPRPNDTACGVCTRDAYCLADVSIGADVLKVPLCAECHLLFTAHPHVFTLSRLVGADRDVLSLDWPARE